MCEFGKTSAQTGAEDAAARANARADEALAEARAANEAIGAALIMPADSEAARKKSEDRQRKLIGAGGGVAPMPITAAPIGTQMLFGA